MSNNILNALEETARELAWAKRQAEQAKTAYDMLRIVWEEQPEVADAIEAKANAASIKSECEDSARKLLDDLLSELPKDKDNKPLLPVDYFSYRNTKGVEVTDAQAVASWLVENMPSAAVSLMAEMIDKNSGALLNLLKGNADKNDQLKNGYESIEGVVYSVTPKATVNWSKLPEVD
jgi:hypothetical protein